MNENATEKFYRHHRDLTQVSTQLFELASSFHNTGNVALGLRLHSLAQLIIQAKIGMAGVYDETLINRTKEAFQTSPSAMFEDALTDALIAIDAQGGLDDG